MLYLCFCYIVENVFLAAFSLFLLVNIDQIMRAPYGGVFVEALIQKKTVENVLRTV